MRLSLSLLCCLCLLGFSPAPPGDATMERVTGALMKALGSRLKQEMGEKGPVAAVTACSLEAMPLTRKVSAEHGLQVSRVTDKPRNPANRADEDDLAILAMMKRDQAAGSLKPLYRKDDAAYKPLVTGGLCLVCHGETRPPELQKVLDERYPDDQATGYQAGQIRGAIKVVTVQ